MVERSCSSLFDGADGGELCKVRETEIKGSTGNYVRCERKVSHLRVFPEGTTIVLLGAGRVATHLLPALVRGGGRVVQVWSRTLLSAQTLAAPLGIPHTDRLDEVTSEADIYIACVSDGALPALTREIVARVARADALFVHTAGSVPMDVWHSAGAVRYGILYPLQTFSKERAVDLELVSFFVEGSDEASLQKVEGLAYGLSEKVYRADSSVRARLHVSAVFACNFTNAMYGVAQRLLQSGGIPFDVLLPLIDETAAKVHTLSPHDAQTGPAVRGDYTVMQQHMESLSENPELQRVYEQISRLIIDNKQ